MSLKDELYEIALQNIEGMTEEEARYYLENDAIPASGSVSGLIYYNETEPLACDYYDEIIEIMQEIYGDCILADILTLNNMTWFAWEYLILGNEEVIDEIIELAHERNILKEEERREE